MKIDTSVQIDLDRIKAAILKELGEVEAIYLFGSVAKGTQNERSDYDILIFVDHLPDNKVKTISRIRYSLLGQIKRPLEVFVLELEDLKYSSPFLYEVYYNNQLIQGKNVILRCKNAIDKMKPLILNGVKVGYYV